MAPLRSLSRTTLLDVAVVLFITAVTEWAVFETREHISTPIAGPRWLTVPLPLLIALPLLWRRRRPLLVAVLGMTGLGARAAGGGHPPGGFRLFLFWFLAPYGGGAYSARRTALIGLAVVLAGFTVYAVQNDDIVSGRAS